MANPSTPPRGGPLEPQGRKGDFTLWRKWWTKGERHALDQLVPLVYAELRRIAGGYAVRRPVDASLQPTALINEAFVRLIGRNGVDWKNRPHFFGVAGKTMLGILVDEARKQMAAKRGGMAVTVCFDDGFDVPGGRRDLDLVALDDALTSLAEVGPELTELDHGAELAQA